MNLYTLDTIFSYGKFIGKTVREVIELQPSYLHWCISNIENFTISDDVIKIMENQNSEEYWIKIVGMLQQNWALMNVDYKNKNVTIYFFQDTSDYLSKAESAEAIDKLEFTSILDAEEGLIRNGFRKYSDIKDKLPDFLNTPKKPYYPGFNSNDIYSSGKCWV